MAEPALEQPDAAPAGHRNGRLSWLVLFLVATASISLAAVHLPPRVKMLGLFAIGHGLLAGWIAAWLTSAFNLPAGKATWSGVVVFVVILGGQIGMAVESHRLDRAAAERAIAANPKRVAILRMLESSNFPDDPKSKQLAEDARRTIGARGFADYLQFRVSALGIQSRPLAATIWIFEIGLGSLAGIWIFGRLTARRMPIAGRTASRAATALQAGQSGAGLSSATRLEAGVPPAKLEE
jgi:hypothetical protein